MNPMLVLSYIQAAQLLTARRAGQATVIISPDLGLSQVEVTLGPDKVVFPTQEQLAWSRIEEIAAAENVCFAVEGNCLQRIQQFSAMTNRFCSLMPTALAPALLIAGFPMHRIKDTDPYHDTLNKIKAVKPIGGRVLDTATGLGYTAIEASRTADQVITIEIDPTVLEIAQLNPWSRELFDNPKISQRVGDSCEVVETFEDEAFSCIIHDPPTISLAGDLYSGEFYRQMFRVLTRRGRLFHYIGSLESGQGQRVAQGAIRRLQAAGFGKVRPCPQAFGLLACK